MIVETSIPNSSLQIPNCFDAPQPPQKISVDALKLACYNTRAIRNSTTTRREGY